MRVILWMLVTAAIGSAGFALAYLWAPAVGPVSPQALNYSLATKTGGTGIWGLPGCRRDPRREAWSCEVWDESVSGTNTYVVHRHGRRCWDARLLTDGGEGAPRKRVSGCVQFRHQMRLAERALN